MTPTQFDSFLARVGLLSPLQLDALAAAVKKKSGAENSIRTIETAGAKTFCPKCGFDSMARNGKSRGLQRFLCRTCGRSFTHASETPLSGLRMKERFAEFAQCMIDGLSVRATARRMDIAASTAFRWRHRFLEAAASHQPRGLTGMVEADETYLRQSSKGSRNLGRLPRKRGGARMRPSKGKPQQAQSIAVLVLKARGSGHVADWVCPQFGQADAEQAAISTLAKDALLCTDGSGAFRTIERDLGFKVESLAVSYDGRTRAGPAGVVYHLQGVNNYHERMKSWLNNDLRGVSTGRLPNYLAWMRMREWFKAEIAPEHFIVTGLGHQIINT